MQKPAAGKTDGVRQGIDGRKAGQRSYRRQRGNGHLRLVHADGRWNDRRVRRGRQRHDAQHRFLSAGHGAVPAGDRGEIKRKSLICEAPAVPGDCGSFPSDLQQATG